MKYYYILELIDGKFYVGKTNNINRRFMEHKLGIGAKWTKQYPPIRIIKFGVIFHSWTENYYTLYMMKKHGVNNTRGGSWCCLKSIDEPWFLHYLDETLSINDNYNNFLQLKNELEIFKFIQRMYNNY